MNLHYRPSDFDENLVQLNINHIHNHLMGLLSAYKPTILTSNLVQVVTYSTGSFFVNPTSCNKIPKVNFALFDETMATADGSKSRRRLETVSLHYILTIK